MTMVNWWRIDGFCGMAHRRWKAEHGSDILFIADILTAWVGFKPEQNIISSLFKKSFAGVIASSPQLKRKNKSSKIKKLC